MAGSRADFYRTYVIGPALLAACGNVQGLHVLDIGCGQGFFSRLLAQRGANVLGVDISDRLIDHALRREQEVPLGIVYRVLDARELATRLPPASFDMVVSCIALQDMENLPRVLRGVKVVLKRDGHTVVLVEHPTNTCAYREWERDKGGGKIVLRLDRYFQTGPRIVSWTLPSSIGERRSFEFPSTSRTLEEWSEALTEAGFLIFRLYEPRPTTKQVEDVPELYDCFRMPYFLIFDLVLRERLC
jgi:ubiquinone/menaquinone biosynthesis C-methylase UbiE